MITAADVWPIVKLRLALADDSHQPLIATYIAELEHRIKHYCNIERLPDGLLYTWPVWSWMPFASICQMWMRSTTRLAGRPAMSK